MKSLLLFIVLLLFTITTWGQQYKIPKRIFSDDNKTFYGGITLGCNMSEVIGDAYHGYHKAGLLVGAGVTAKFKQRLLGMSLDILYSQKGSRGVRTVYSNYVGNSYERYYLDLNYVEVPFQLLIIPSDRYYFGAGISYSRLVKSNERIVTQQAPYNFHQENYPFLNDDWDWLVSAKYQFWRGWFIGARYSRSFKYIRHYDSVPPYYGSGNQYNMYFTIMLSYLIP